MKKIRINRLSLTGFTGIRDCDIEFPEDIRLFLLIGENRQGKSVLACQFHIFFKSGIFHRDKTLFSGDARKTVYFSYDRKNYVAVHTWDSKLEKGSSSLYSGTTITSDAVPLNPGNTVTGFANEVAARFNGLTQKTIFLNRCLHLQPSVPELDPAERKAVLLKTFGQLSEYEVLFLKIRNFITGITADIKSNKTNIEKTESETEKHRELLRKLQITEITSEMQTIKEILDTFPKEIPFDTPMSVLQHIPELFDRISAIYPALDSVVRPEFPGKTSVSESYEELLKMFDSNILEYLEESDKLEKLRMEIRENTARKNSLRDQLSIYDIGELVSDEEIQKFKTLLDQFRCEYDKTPDDMIPELSRTGEMILDGINRIIPIWERWLPARSFVSFNQNPDMVSDMVEKMQEQYRELCDQHRQRETIRGSGSENPVPSDCNRSDCFYSKMARSLKDSTLEDRMAELDSRIPPGFSREIFHEVVESYHDISAGLSKFQEVFGRFPFLSDFPKTWPEFVQADSVWLNNIRASLIRTRERFRAWIGNHQRYQTLKVREQSLNQLANQMSQITRLNQLLASVTTDILGLEALYDQQTMDNTKKILRLKAVFKKIWFLKISGEQARSRERQTYQKRLSELETMTVQRQKSESTIQYLDSVMIDLMRTKRFLETKHDIYSKISDISNPKTGDFLSLLDDLFRSSVKSANNMIETIFPGGTIVVKYDLSDSTCRFPIVINGTELSDLKAASESERNILKICLTAALSNSDTDQFVVDEMDDNLSIRSHQRYPDLIRAIRDVHGVGQLLLISHDSATIAAFAEDDGVGVIEFPGAAIEKDHRVVYSFA